MIVAVRGDAGDADRGDDPEPRHDLLPRPDLVEAVGGGSLTIDAGSDGSTADFILEDGGLILVTQESLLALAGERFTNNGLIQVEGVATTAEGLELIGKGIVEIDSGGRFDIDGTIGPGQKLLLADGTGNVSIGDVDDFHARIGLTEYGGNRFRLEDLRGEVRLL